MESKWNVSAVILWVLLGLFCLGGLSGGCMYGWPKYKVYEQGLVGEAELRRAEQNRKIKIQEADAYREASRLYAEAEVERAKGVAQANQIIGDGLRGNHEYLVYLWIRSLSDKDNHVIYVPTEGQLPILEAGRFLKPLGGAKDKK